MLGFMIYDFSQILAILPPQAPHGRLSQIVVDPLTIDVILWPVAEHRCVALFMEPVDKFLRPDIFSRYDDL